jgi:6-pyruvoyltetrahydropterin/6-carboxytetrahydropterin synthase
MKMVTRVYRFSASHRLHSAQLSLSENQRIFGKCNNPYGHGHDYVLEVSVRGEVDLETGLIIPISQLDRLVTQTVLSVFAHRNINTDVPDFSELIPTTENIALVITRTLQSNWPSFKGNGTAELYRVHIQETARNGFEVFASEAVHSLSADTREGVLTNA